MSNPVTIRDVIARSGAEKTLRTAPPQEPPRPVIAGRKIVWIALLTTGLIALLLIGRSILANLEVWTLTQLDDVSVKVRVAVNKVSGSADYLEALAERTVQPDAQDFDVARTAAEATVQADPSRAHAWALLAYLESERSGYITPSALDALNRSMAACPLCDQDLIRWHFNFVLANWDALPEKTRRQAFEQADSLRWIGENSEFLAEMRIKALGAGIPFDDYRRAVNTPVRALDIGLAPEAVMNSPHQKT